MDRSLNEDKDVPLHWKKTGKVPRWADKLVRLLYLARAEGSTPIAPVLERINAVERAEKNRIVLRAAKSGWTSKLESQSTEKIAFA